MLPCLKLQTVTCQLFHSSPQQRTGAPTLVLLPSPFDLFPPGPPHTASSVQDVLLPCTLSRLLWGDLMLKIRRSFGQQRPLDAPCGTFIMSSAKCWAAGLEAWTVSSSSSTRSHTEDTAHGWCVRLCVLLHPPGPPFYNLSLRLSISISIYLSIYLNSFVF